MSSSEGSQRSRSRSPGEIPLHSHPTATSATSANSASLATTAPSSSSSTHHSEYAGEDYEYGEHRMTEDGEASDQRRHRSNGDGSNVAATSSASVSSSSAPSNSALGLGMGPPHPDDNNPPTRRIYVGNLPLQFNNDDLYRLFATFGTIRESFVTKDTHTGRSKQFGFVEFDQDEQAAHARTSMNGCVLDQYGNKVVGEDDSLIMNGKNPQGELRHKIRIRFAELKKHDESLYMDDRLYISNLPDYVTDADLRNKFEQFGELTEAIFATAKDTRQRLGSAFVQYKDPQAAKSALETLNGTHWNEREKKNEMAPLRINFARKQRVMIREERIAAGRGPRSYDAPRSTRRSPTTTAAHSHSHYPAPPHHYVHHHYPPHHYPPHHAYPPYSYPYPYPHSSNSSSSSASRSSYEHRERSRSRSRDRDHRYERESRRETRRRSRSRTRSRSRSPRQRREREHRESHTYAGDAYQPPAYHPHYTHYAYPDAPYYPNTAYPPASSASAAGAAHRDDLDSNHRAHHSAHAHRRRDDHAYHTDNDNYGR